MSWSRLPSPESRAAERGRGMISMRGRALIDTNVLVYAYDVSEPERQRRALDLLHVLAERETGVVSTQIMAETFVVLTRKLSSPLSVEQAVRSLARDMRTWQVA